jgi:hypothetical protein
VGENKTLITKQKNPPAGKLRDHIQTTKQLLKDDISIFRIFNLKRIGKFIRGFGFQIDRPG